MTEAQIRKLANKDPHQLTEKEWNAKYDAQTLANAELIKSDATRYATAKAWASVLLIQENKENDALKTVANG